MKPILRLEYACTVAEMEEAQELNTRQQIGGGSKWRTTVVLYLTLAGFFAALYLKFRREISPAYQPYAFGGVLVLWLGLIVWQRRSRKSPSSTDTVEISESELTVLDGESRVTMPWSAFSQCLESPRLFVLVDQPKGTLIILPKRVFPDEDSESWLRSVASNRQSSAPAAANTSITGQTVSAEGIVVKFRLGFRDYLDRTVASWRTWGVFFLLVGLMGGITVHSAFNPPPRAVYSAAQVFFFFELPILLALLPFLILLVAFQSWQAHSGYLVPQEWALSDQSLAFVSRDGKGLLPWTTYTRFKETRWSFILWNPVGSAWIMFPKRAFASHDDVRLCQALLARQLQQSRWFFG